MRTATVRCRCWCPAGTAGLHLHPTVGSPVSAAGRDCGSANQRLLNSFNAATSSRSHVSVVRAFTALVFSACCGITPPITRCLVRAGDERAQLCWLLRSDCRLVMDQHVAIAEDMGEVLLREGFGGFVEVLVGVLPVGTPVRLGARSH